MDQPFLERVRLRNYKSVAQCDVELGRFTVLVGRNGSGKSNFLDALRFVADSLQSSLDHAIKERAGIDAVRRRSTGHPHNFTIELVLVLPGRQQWARYGFEIAARRNGGFAVRWEKLALYPPGKIRPPRQPDSPLQEQTQLDLLRPAAAPTAFYEVREGAIQGHSAASMPPAPADRLYLVNAAGLPDFRPVYDALTAMGFYNLNPETIKDLQSPDAGELLRRDGSNIASVIARLGQEDRACKERIKDYLEKIVPGITDFDRLALGPKETLQFRQRIQGATHPWTFYAANMSDGTLRALGILVAVNQVAASRHAATLVGIEEPETALHPAASGALIDALRSASQDTQIVFTSHSPDLLDHIDPTADEILVVQSDEGTSRIATIDRASRETIKDHLYTAGDLLRMDQLEGDADDLAGQDQLEFWPKDESGTAV